MSVSVLLWPFVATVLFIASSAVLDLRRRKRDRTPYPPGPKPRLFVGNLLDISASKPWKVYHDLGKIYGNLMHFKVIGQHIVVVNSRDLAQEMFEKRSQIYSDRPSISMLDLMGFSTVNTGVLRYGPDWRFHRRVYNQGFRATVVSDYQPILSAKSGQLLSNLHQSPDSFLSHIKTYAAASILATLYGYDVGSSKDWLVEIAEETANAATEAIHPSAMLVNILPFLRHLPLEFPIFGFQRIARRTRRLMDEMRTAPYEYVKNSAAETGERKFSLLAMFLEKQEAKGGDEREEGLMRDALTTAYGAGTETIVSTLVTFFLAMAVHPQIQARAQRELDAVTERDRLSTYAERSDLPYVEAVLRETLRWLPSGPLGFPHSAIVDDTFNNYFIPKGTIVFGNIWAMSRDEDIYPEPESFFPDRFLTEKGTCNEDQVPFVFGFGRRMCPGRHFANLTVWTAMTSILSQFEIGPAEDMEGRLITRMADVNYSDSNLVSRLENFRCVIKPRRRE